MDNPKKCKKVLTQPLLQNMNVGKAAPCMMPVSFLPTNMDGWLSISFWIIHSTFPPYSVNWKCWKSEEEMGYKKKKKRVMTDPRFVQWLLGNFFICFFSLPSHLTTLCFLPSTNVSSSTYSTNSSVSFFTWILYARTVYLAHRHE